MRGGNDTGKVRAPRRHRKREREAHEVVRRVADDRLVEIAKAHLDAAFGVGERAQVADVAIPADPHRRPVRERARRDRPQPFVELRRVASHIRVHRRRHLVVATCGKRFRAAVAARRPAGDECKPRHALCGQRVAPGLPAASALRETIRHDAQHVGVPDQPEVAALDFDVLGEAGSSGRRRPARRRCRRSAK